MEGWFLLAGDLKFFCHGLFIWLSRGDGNPGRLDARWFVRSVQSGAGYKLLYDATGVPLKHRWKNRALSAEDIEGGAYGSLVLALGSLSAMTSSVVVGNYSVR